MAAKILFKIVTDETVYGPFIYEADAIEFARKLGYTHKVGDELWHRDGRVDKLEEVRVELSV